jgi:hypothetical protein
MKFGQFLSGLVVWYGRRKKKRWSEGGKQEVK